MVNVTTLDADWTGQAMILSPALPPISAKVEAKIKSSLYVLIKNLLDNMSLCTQMEVLLGPQYAYAALPKPKLREIQAPLTWISRFLTYTKVLTQWSTKPVTC